MKNKCIFLFLSIILFFNGVLFGEPGHGLSLIKPLSNISRLTLNTPNGGENWRVGTQQNITWVSENIGNIKIEYSTNNGTDWLTVISSTAASAGSYSWVVPNTLSAVCKVKISDVNDITINDLSNNYFTIYQSSITVNVPNGGEMWRVATTQNITWNSNNVQNIKIEYTTNNGTSWSTVITNTPATSGSYAWIVPNTVSINCKVKLSDVAELTLNDVSENTFTIYQPAITLVSPDGGESWRVGTAQNITWHSENVQNVKIEYTTNNGTNWSTIITSTPANVGSYTWTVPNTVSANCKVKITDVIESTLNDISHNVFTIFQPSIAIISPNGGENWRVGSQQNITWTSNNITNVKIEFTTNNGTNWNIVSESTLANAGSFTWLVPNTASANCKVKISDVLEPAMNDESNNSFTIYSPNITIISPNGGENWRVGTSQNITWSSSNINNVKIEYTTNNGTNWSTVIASTPANTGSYAWLIPNMVSSTCKVRISDVTEPTLNDVSNNPFTIYQPNITITSPDGGELWRVGTTQNITWSSSNVANIKIEYSTNNGTNWTTLLATTPANAGTYAWLIPNTITNAAKVRVSDVLEPTMMDESNSVFTIYQPTIALTSPNGGENWSAGSQQNITWNSNNITNIKIEYTTNSGTDWLTVIANTAASAGSYNWVVPNTLSALCKVKISDILEPAMNDESNGTFAIYQAVLSVLSPNGGENWRVGTSKNITWSSSNITNVKIEYTTNNGTNWSTVIATTPASSGSYTWAIPNNPSQNCKVRISDALNTTINDVSNNTFVIYQPLVVITTPNGGENWRVGTNQNITWTSNNVANVKIEYSINNGTNWSIIATSTPANVGSYTWQIPNTVSTNCKVKISDVIEPEIKDESNGLFAIFSVRITIISPNGGENWRVGTNQYITWTSSNINNVKIEYTTNDGTDWNTLLSSIASTGLYNWFVPNVISANCKIKISDVLEPNLNDTSDEVFSIYNPVLTVFTPNGGENWQTGTTQSITWNSANLTSVKIEYTTNNGINWLVIADSVAANSSAYSWIIPNTISTNCKVRISDKNDESFKDESDAVFTIYTVGITIITPNGGENWRFGTQHNITWISSNITNVKLEYSTTGGTDWFIITESISASLCSYSWMIPNNIISEDCLVRISNVANLAIYDDSDNKFTIYDAGFTLITPNGGEYWSVASKRTIRWTSANVEKILIEYTTNNGINWLEVITNIPANTGTYVWTIPNTVATNCKIRISSTSDLTLNDVSNSVFSIYNPTLALTSPNGGEVWRVGSQHNITWTSSSISNVKIEYKTIGSTNWIPIANSTVATTGSFLWTIPNIAPITCSIKISNVLDSVFFDESDGIFSIISQSLTVTNPIEGDSLRVGKNYEIKWISIDVDNIKIEYSTDAGSTWLIITNVTALTGSYIWLVPNTTSSNCKIKLSYITDPTLYSISGKFSISPTIIAINNPNGGEILRTGTHEDIKWTCSYQTNVKIDYTTNNGTDWTNIVESISSTLGQYSWLIPNTISSYCKIRIYDISDSQVVDESDNVFSICQPSIQLTSPNGGEYWRAGTNHNVTWASSYISKVKIEYSVDNGVVWAQIIDNIDGSLGTYNWTIPDTTSVNCKIRISDIDYPSLFDVSDDNFSLYDPNLVLTSPNGGENWRAGTTKNITWSASNIDSLKLEYSTDNGVVWNLILESNAANTNNYDWVLPNIISTDCKIRLSNVLDSTVFDESDNVFSIYQPAISITVPNGWQNWRAGTQQNITWTSNNIENVKIDLSTNDGVDWSNISNSTPAVNGTFSFIVPNYPSVNCRVRISDVNEPEINAVSANSFTIFNPQIIIVNPNGGEKIKAGTQNNINWTSNNIENVKIEYSTNGGSDWVDIITSISASTGAYNWLVPNIYSVNCKIRISDILEPLIKDESNNVFTIFNQELTLTNPIGGNNFRAGKQETITWSSLNVSNVKVEYTTNGGVDWTAIIASTAANTGSYTWTVPIVSSTDCKVKISDVDNISINDVSEAVFTIYTPTITITSTFDDAEYSVGSIKSITWTCENVENIKIEYSTNNGTDWLLIESSVASNTGSYAWTIPNTTSVTCKVRLSDVTDNTLNSQSTNTFTIFAYPATIPVVRTVSFGDVYSPSSCKIIGLPGNNDIPVNETVTGTVKTDWNVYYDNGNTSNYYVEYDGTDVFNFRPGRAFWIISKNGMNISTNKNTVTVDNNNYYAISLHSGWNLISNPFEKDVNWNKIIQINGITLNPLLYSWNSAWNSAASVISPYEGYYFYNAHNKTNLKIPYSPSGAGSVQLAKMNKLNENTFICLELIKENVSINKIYTAINDSASLDFDINDYYAAPGNFEDISLKIYNNNLSSGYKYLFTDTRPLIDEGQMFDLQTKNNTGSVLELVWNKIPETYKDYETYLVDRRINKFYDLKTLNKIDLPAYYKENNFSLLIGTENYINDIKQSLLPSEYILYQNYPNPFNAGTVIRYSLPYESEINITLYNIVGEVVKVITNTKQEAGYYEQQLQMNNFASGVYFYSINAKSIDGKHNFNTTKKMVLLK
ncbi:MAG: T9SS type A sorting domain-containing protein [bacterium]